MRPFASMDQVHRRAGEGNRYGQRGAVLRDPCRRLLVDALRRRGCPGKELAAAA